MTKLSVLGRSALTELSARAAATPRLRLNRNLHHMGDPVHRLLNAIEPGSYVRPHRHLSPPKSETVVAVAGAIGVVTFDPHGVVQESIRLEAGGEVFLADIPPDVWHTLLALRPGSVFFETKIGPYTPPAPEDLAAWAPPEGDKEVIPLLENWAKLFTTNLHED